MELYNNYTATGSAGKVSKTKSKKPGSKKNIAFTIIGLISLLGGIACIVTYFFLPEDKKPDLVFPTIPSKTASEAKNYSPLTGKEVATAADVKAPIYCVQTPNGMDGARPQAGLNEAGVVFEAIAEAGITRFAALYQNPTSAVIGPIRSLRLYYLQWDTPFDCTIVHAGGADDALAAVRTGGYKDLTENYTYMYRGTNGERRWNNLFTTSSYLSTMNADWQYGESNASGFKRMTPEESLVSRVDNTVVNKLDITKPATGDTSALTPKVSNIGIRFGGLANFNVDYSYNVNTNSYNRSFESGNGHEVYACPSGDHGEANPEDICELTLLSPSVVIAMIVEEHKAEDNYHEDISAIGSGTAYIFQNGIAIKGSWSKHTASDQIKFTDSEGDEILLAPGQTFVEAVPDYGSVEY